MQTIHSPQNKNLSFVWMRLCASFALSVGGVVVACITVRAKPQDALLQNAPIPLEKVRISQIALDKISKSFVRVVSIKDQNTIIFVSIDDLSRSKGEIIKWNLSLHKAVGRAPLSILTDPGDLTLLLGGKFLVAQDNKSDISVPEVQSHRVTVLDADQLRVLKTFDLGDKIDITVLMIEPAALFDNEHIVLKLTTLVPVENDFVYRDDRFAWLNVTTGKLDRTLPYSHARGASKILFSTDKEYLACLFQNDEDDSDHRGVIDILNAQTGEILWHLQGTERQPIGAPLFFISPTQFVSSSMLYDIETKKITPLLLKDKRPLECLNGVPQHPDYAFFMTQQGVELWNWRAKKALRRWPALKQKGTLSFSPDLRSIVFRNNSIVQFWKFDAAWLKPSTQH